MSKGDLLDQLRLDRSTHRPADAAHIRRGTSRLLVVAIVAGVIASGCLAWALWGHDNAIVAEVPAQTQATAEIASGSAHMPPAATPAAQGGRADILLQATGYVAARRRATVSAQITGMLVDVNVEEGDRVERGQVLARLDDNSLSASQRAASAELLAARAKVEQVKAEVDHAERKATRQEELLGTQLVSRETAEQARTEVKTLHAQLRAAERQAESARAQSDMADVAVAYTEVKAPFAGVVIRKDAQVGEIVSPQSNGGFTRSGICTIVDMDSLEVDVDVNEAYIGRVKTGMAGEVVLDAYPGWRIPARVVAIVPTADRGKATVRVRVGFETKDSRIVPDMGARVSFLKQAENPAGAGSTAERADTTAPDAACTFCASAAPLMHSRAI